MEISQVFVRFLDGRTRCLQISSPTISGLSLKQNIFEITRIPVELLRLVSGSREISNETLVCASQSPSLNLLLRLRGGKGGFGSLLRGAATKAGQKKTNNFDACRDMSGRRLRHVNAEKKLEEWKAEVEERKLEKIAENFLKKKAKEGKNSKTGDAEKYVQSYRDVSAKCMEEVEASVRQSFELYQSSKRKVLPAAGQSAKRLKMLNGKGKEVESDTDDEDDEVLISTILVQGDDELDRSPGLSSLVHTDGESSGGSPSKSTLDNGSCNDGNFNSESDCKHEASNEDSGTSVDSQFMDVKPGSDLDGDPISRTPEVDNIIKAEDGDSHSESVESTDVSGTVTFNVVASPVLPGDVIDVPSQMEIGKACEESSLDRPFDLKEFESAKDLEIVGMERLKVELQANGLKCGGTLQERAARLFMLKTTPIEKFPKKLLAKSQLSN